MFFKDLHGRPHPESEAVNVFKVQSGWAGPEDAQYEAVVVGGREYIINLTAVVNDASGAFLGYGEVQVAHNNPAPNEGKVDLGSGLAKHFATNDAGVKGIQLGGGSKIGPDGPVDEVWVHGSMPDGGRIRSQKVKVGLYSTDIVLSPVFEVRRRNGGTPTPPPFNGTILEEVAKIEQAAFNIRKLSQ